MCLKTIFSVTLLTILCFEKPNAKDNVSDIVESIENERKNKTNFVSDVKLKINLTFNNSNEDYFFSEMEFYKLFIVTKTFMNYYNLKKILICSGENTERTLLRQILKSSLLWWSVIGCDSAMKTMSILSWEEPLEEGCAYGGDLGSRCSSSRLLILLLCSNEEQNRILDEAQKRKFLNRWIFLLRTKEGRSFPSSLYIPLNTMVISISKKNASYEEHFSLTEHWKVGPFLALQESEIGYITFDNQLNTTDLIDTQLNYASVTSDGSTHEGCSRFSQCGVFQCWQIGRERRKDPGDILQGESPTEPFLLLCVNQIPIYVRRKNLTGLHFRISTINDSRAHHNYYDDIKEKIIFTGFFGDVWEALRGELNFQYSISTPADGEFGAKDVTGKWTGLVGDLVEGRTDVIVALLSRTRGRSRVVDYTTSLLKFSYRIFGQRSQSSELMWQVYTSPFSLELWCSILSALFVFSAALFVVDNFWLCAKQNKNREKNREEISGESSYFLKSWAALTMQGWPSTPNRMLPRLIIFEMYILGTVLYSSYSGTLVSFLAVTDDGFPFETLEDLVKSSEYKLGILQGSVLEEVFQTGPFIESWNKLIMPYKNTLAEDYNQLISSSFQDPKFLYVGSYEVQMLNIEPPCSIRATKQTLFYNDGSIGLPKHSPYLGLFNYYIGKLGESGILKKLKEKHYPSPLKCSSPPYRPMTMEQTFTAFLILLTGMMISSAILAIEKLKK